MNTVILIGRLTTAPEVRYANNQDQTCIARFRLAVDRPHSREGSDNADFIPIKCFGNTAKLAEKYLNKGMKIAVEGCIQTGSYTKDDGTKVYTTEVIASRVEFCERKTDSAAPTRNINDLARFPEAHFTDMQSDEEDLPF